MWESCKYGSVGGASGNRRFYPAVDGKKLSCFFANVIGPPLIPNVKRRSAPLNGGGS